MARFGRPRFLWSVVVMLAIARASPGQTRTCSTTRADSAVPSSHWAPPLDRLVSLRAPSISLRDAIDRVAAAARLRVSYSAELLPLGRAECVEAERRAAGDVLAELLAGTKVAAVGVGDDRVVLAPRAAAERSPTTAVTMSSSIGVLDRVVVTGSAITGEAERGAIINSNVVDGRRLARENTNTLGGALDAYVPGVWSWAHSPSSMMSSYASIRGASSFGLSYPKIYIDGIEVANPLLIGRFDAGAIDHIEVIRGPQGSALYGTGAISGVVNIVTRHEGASADGSVASLRTSAGLSQSLYARNVLAQDHELSLTTGTSARSADLHVAGGSIGSFIPDGYSRDLMATGSARIVGDRTTFSTTARLFLEQAGTPSSPLIAELTRALGGPARSLSGPMRGGMVQGGGLTAPNTSPQSVSEYTLGGTATTSPNERWTHSFVAGIDGYRLSNVQANFAPVPSIVDSALRAAEGGADRATVRASSEMHFAAGERTRGSMTFAAEHSTLRLATVAEEPAPFIQGAATMGGQRLGMPGAAHDERITSWQNSTGLTGQTSLAWNDALFATAGVRLEHDSRLAGTDQIEALPMLGAATVSQVGPLTVKWRAAYGEGIRPPTTMSSTELWQIRNNPSAPPLGPERQSGVEAGVDVSFRQALTVQVTRFDQRASGLIQQVVTPIENGAPRRMMYAAQNVGEISNTGWELQATSTVSHLAVTGALSFVNSRVEKLAPGYTGDLITGDRMLQVPGRTGSLNLGWTSDRWFASLGGSRAIDWINYDELALAQAFMSDAGRSRDLTGLRLRDYCDYWRHYNGGLHLRATTSHDIRDGFAIELTADNLLNYQRGEPDNLTIIPGRTIMTGIRVRF